MTKKKENIKLDDLIREVKENPVNTPLQKVVSKKKNKRDDEVFYGLWVHKEMIQELKIIAIKENTNVKDLIINCIKKEYYDEFKHLYV